MIRSSLWIAGVGALISASVTLTQVGGVRSAPPAVAPAPPPSPAPGPATPAQNPATPAQNPATPAQNPATPAQNPATPAQNPATPAQNPATPAQNPATPAQNPATPNQRPATPAQNPAVPAQNPATPAQNPVNPAQQPGAAPQGPALPNSSGQPGVSAASLNPQAQTMLTGLTGLNLQNANVQNVAAVNANLTGGQVNALIQAVAGNATVEQKAAALTQQLRQQGRIGADQQVVGYDNGRVLVATNAQIAAAAAKGTAQIPPQQLNALVTGLADTNTQTLQIQGITNANTMFNPNQVTALSEAIVNNPEARHVANRLTLKLVADGRIRADQRVLGIQDGKVIVSTPSP